MFQNKTDLVPTYPGTIHDRLFEATYGHVKDGKSCEECGCTGQLLPRKRLQGDSPKPAIHFGLIASADTVMKSGKHRDVTARQEGVLAFEMEAAGVWDIFPCVVIKGACDYADSHKTKVWQRYAAATAAACMRAFLDNWIPSQTESGLDQKQSTGPWFYVPYPENESFIGRESILQKLQQQSMKPASKIALSGLGGIGKTQIALAHVYWLHKTSPDVSIFWVHAHNAEKFRQSFMSIAQECQIPGSFDPKADILLLLKRWLERKESGRWLMVIDNADDTHLFFGMPKESVSRDGLKDEGSLGKYIPDCAHGSIIITTRNKETASRLVKGKRPIEVEKMDQEESKQLLQEKLEDDGLDPEDLSTLSSRLEHLPLALIQAAAFIHEKSISASRYLQLLNESDQNFVDLLSNEFETVGRDSEAPRAVAETWILSFKQIRRQNMFASELLSLMSLFNRQGIPHEFLSDYAKKKQELELRGEIQLVVALGVLKAFSFIAEDKSGSFDMHRLVQLVTQKWLTRENKVCLFANQAVLTVSHIYPYGSYDNWVICSNYLPHVYAVLNIAATESDEENLGRAALLHNVGGYFLYKGEYEEAEACLIKAIEIRKTDLGADHPSTLTSMANLASTYRNQGRWEEAEKLDVQVMETSKTKLGADHPNTLTSMTNLASTFWNQGRWEEAEKLFVQVMETSKTKIGADHPYTLTSMANLASTYGNQGRWEEAEKLFVHVMETRKTKLGADHPDSLNSMANLAVTWKQLGRYHDALHLMQQSDEGYNRVLGPDHPHRINYQS
ncbi:P-loop containing nucleoside triphosphate hydrolase protein [Podospora fimiseda]|uniref:P-loop containing nucleoside triphosphate hydrolase protein n=1 Tax=Podospora fimiseda TaxID=252190 RepID=A0AAN7GS16_9PEZI|nr:P-loop containing nucleoside triphosphate hydrolase protein [Podospora fimiseda]